MGESALFSVCSARALSNGCKSQVSPNSGNYIANGKGIHRDVRKHEACGTYDVVRDWETKVGRKLLRFPPTRFLSVCLR